MQHCFDFLVAATQVARCIGILHIIIVGDATGQGGQHLVANVVGADALCQPDESLCCVLVQSHCLGPVGKGGGGGRLLSLAGAFVVTKRRWCHCGSCYCLLLLFLILFFIHCVLVLG